MHSVSPLQVLPLHIVQIIVDHVVGSSRLVFAEIRNKPNEYIMLLRPLLWVCHNFRNVARPLYCSMYDMDLYSIRLYESENRVSQPRPFDLGYPTHHLAKDLTISLTEESIYLGVALEELSRAPYCGQAFPLVRKLTFFVAMDNPSKIDDDVMTDPLVVEANIDTFAQRVKEMAPLVNEIRFELDNSEEQPEITGLYFGILVPRILQLVDRIKYSDYGHTPVSTEFRMEGIRHLVWIECNFDRGDNQFTLLARQNAPTLEYLSLESEQGINVLDLMQNSDGSCVIYSHLRTLKIRHYANVPASLLPVFPGTVPFPILLRLSLHVLCPFGDDTLFRGNSATLEHLVLQLDHSVVTMLCRHKVFTPNSHPMLRFVKIAFINGLVPDPFASANESVLFSLSIGPGAPVREVSGATPIDEPEIALDMIGRHTNIQVLKLVFGSLEVWDIITLIQTLPLLSDLHTLHPKLDSVASYIVNDELTGYLYGAYPSTGKRFRCWHLLYHSFGDHTEAVMCVLLVALACPNFDYAVAPPNMRKGFMTQMEESIVSDPFKKYEPRLRRLMIESLYWSPVWARIEVADSETRPPP